MPYRDPEKQREASRRHYEKNREAMMARAREHTIRTRVEQRAWICEYLQSHPCVDCGEDDPVVLEFDHVDPATKSANVADAISRLGWGMTRLVAEIEKCQVRCCNCHRKRTWKERHWLRASGEVSAGNEKPQPLKQLGLWELCGNDSGG